jgi:hypothetical protein
MTVNGHKMDNGHNGAEANDPLFNLFAKNDGFWWPYRSLAKALMETQKDASAYLEANRKMINEIRDIVRKEQDLSLQISSQLLEGVMENGRARPDPSEVNAMFDRAIASLRELGEAWMEAQVRSLDAMRRHASSGRRPPRRPAAE